MPGQKAVNWFDMPETQYRASQVCRVLGNPKAFQIIKELRRMDSATPSELAPKVNRSLSTVCSHLKTLREVQLVRYQKDGKNTIYRIKNRQVEKVMDRLEALVEDSRTQSK